MICPCGRETAPLGWDRCPACVVDEAVPAAPRGECQWCGLNPELVDGTCEYCAALGFGDPHGIWTRVHGPGPEAEQVPDDPVLLFHRRLDFLGRLRKAVEILEGAE